MIYTPVESEGYKKLKANAMAFVNAMKATHDRLHGCYIVQSHEVEAETVNVIFRCPKGYTLHDEMAHHFSLTRGFITASRTVG